MNLRSYTKQEILEAFDAQLMVFALDSDDSGNDDVLIANAGESYDDVLRDVLFYHELEELPESWSLESLDVEEFKAFYVR